VHAEQRHPFAGQRPDAIRVDEHPARSIVLPEYFKQFPGAHAVERSAQPDVKISSAVAAIDFKFRMQNHSPFGRLSKGGRAANKKGALDNRCNDSKAPSLLIASAMAR
jgi:hypothetical protein